MTAVKCGTRIRNGTMAEGTGGALVSVAGAPGRIFLLTAGHVAVPRHALDQPVPIYAASDPAVAIGELWTWSKLGIGTTVDAALIWVDPAAIDPGIAGYGRAPTGINPNPGTGAALTMYATDGSGAVTTTKVAESGYAIDLEVSEWGGYASYFGQIRTTRMVGKPGDSGAMVFDDQGHVVGMLVGGADGIGDIITPIDAILHHPQWNGALQFVSSVPGDAVPPPRLAGGRTMAPAIAASPMAAPALASAPPATPAPVGESAAGPAYYLEPIPRPSRQGVNQGLTSASSAFMIDLLGLPRSQLTGECQSPENAALRQLVETRQVGPIRVTGLKMALDSLERVFADVRNEAPVLYDLVGTAGMMCCRFKTIRGTVVRDPSNHSWGTAIDLTVGGVLDTPGDNLVLRGLSILSRYFNSHGWYWGSVFPTEDSMHFEVSQEQLVKWRIGGLF